MGLARCPPEERFINSYAAYMGYLLMGVRGLSFLLLTWSTVVLLGGFVSALGKKDFWCVTVITLMQTAGVFNVLMKQKLRNIGYSYFALCDAEIYIRDPPDGTSRARALVTTIARIVMTLAQVLVFSVIMLPLMLFYNFGLYICTGIALWRLVQRDYQGSASDGVAHLKPALDVLYTLAVAQGGLFFYRTAYSFTGGGAAENVINKYKMTGLASDAVRGYLRETTSSGCDVDPSFCVGKDLITYAAGLMESGPPESDSFFSGVCLLDAIIVAERRGRRSKEIEHLLTGSGKKPSDTLHKLLCMLDSKMQYVSTEMRKRAARVVEHVAGSVHLELYPSGIHRIVSLLPTSPGRCFNPNADDKELMLLGMRILLELAADNTDNCRIMSDTKGFLSRAAVPIRPVNTVPTGRTRFVTVSALSEPLAEVSLKLLDRLIAVPGDTGIKMRRQISSDNNLIYDIESIAGLTVKYVASNMELRVKAKKFITDLSMDIIYSKIASRSREIGITVLLAIFFHDDNISSSDKISAGEKLARLSHESASNAEKILKGSGDVVGSLTNILLYAENNAYRVSAAEILAGLCTHCAGDEFGKVLKKAIVDLIPEVLRGIHNRSAVSSGQGSTQGEMNLQRALLALCVPVCNETLIGGDPDLAHKLHEVANKFCSGQGLPFKTLASLMKEARKLLDMKRQDSACAPAGGEGSSEITVVPPATSSSATP